jgi:hypothetical protein
MIGTVLKWAVVVLVAATAVLYCGDYVVIKIRAAMSPSAAFSVIKYRPTMAIPHKDGRQEFVFGDPATETCVNSLLPHFGDRPCWYVRSQVRDPIPMMILPAVPGP